MQVHNKSSLVTIRRTLRKKQTPAEFIFWKRIRGRKLNGLKFTRQHSIGNYIVDFYCPEFRIIIELDGEIHKSIFQLEKDKFRDQNLIEMGFTVLRFQNHEVLVNSAEIEATILKHKDKLLPSP